MRPGNGPALAFVIALIAGFTTVLARAVVSYLIAALTLPVVEPAERRSA
jgi:phage shock protein PspC (stress-responsive transcriptional regulator)